MKELYKVYRPKTFAEVIGQQTAIASIEKLAQKGRIPHAIALTGDSGVGKTTIARIIARTLKCAKHDLQEINSADNRGIDTVREISRTMNLNPMCGPVRVWIIDEFHKTTNDFQNAFLRISEDTPKHVYFILCTTEYGKVIKALKTRFTEFRLSALLETDMRELLDKVIESEGMNVSSEIADLIVEASEGSARQALVTLEKVGLLDTVKEQRESVLKSSPDGEQTIALCRVLLTPRSQWADCAKILKGLTDEPESIRRAVLGYAQAVLLSGNNPRAFCMLDVFASHFYDSGKPGLTAACYEVIHSK